MNKKNNILKSPTGMKAYLPRVALELKELKGIQKLQSLGYQNPDHNKYLTLN